MIALTAAGAHLMAGSTVVAEAKQIRPPDEIALLAAGDPEGNFISMEEVAKHDSLDKGIWVVIQGQVYECVFTCAYRLSREAT